VGGAPSFIIGDLRDPENVLLQAEATLDLDQPAAPSSRLACFYAVVGRKP
jgi:hypothetical protein